MIASNVRLSAVTLGVMWFAVPALGGTATVTTAQDVIDIDWPTATLADLPGPDGVVSLSEAFIATNNTPGHDTIGFAIPLAPGAIRADIFVSNGFFLRASDAVTIDGTTQTAYSGDTNPNGAEVRVVGSTLFLNAADSGISGFDSTSISLNGANGLVENNTGNTNIDVFGGGGSTIRNNIGGTIKIDRSSSNVVVGNTVQRVRVWGFGENQPAVGNRIGGPAPEDRNILTGYGTHNGEGLPSGTTVELFDTVDTLVENNWIGTADGLTQGSLASIIGIGLTGSNEGTVISDNLISGILGHGTGPHHAGQLFGTSIFLQGTADNVRIVGNTIGLDIHGQPLLGSVTGIDVGTWNNQGLTNVQVGGTTPDEANTIAGHLFDGIVVDRQSQEARIRGNSIWGNGHLGIDLMGSDFSRGVTLNDPFDADTGGNGLQNFPVLASAAVEAGSLHVRGALGSEPDSQYAIDFFASPVGDESGYGEGQLYLGEAMVRTDSAGEASFDLLLPVLPPVGWMVTSTATNEIRGSTSEFSAWIDIAVPHLDGDFNNDGIVTVADYTVWRDNLGADEESGVLGGNGTGGTVGRDDYLMWKQAMDAGSLAAEVTPVPEPSPLVLLQLMLLTAIGIQQSSWPKVARWR